MSKYSRIESRTAVLPRITTAVYSRIESRTAVLTLGVVSSSQYSCPRLNTTVLGHDTGLISTHPFHDTFINQYTNV